MKIKVLLCNWKGLCPSFRNSDMNTLPFEIESGLYVQPQLCGQGGNEALADAPKSADQDTYILSGACAPEAQEKLFKKLLRLMGFPRFIALDIRGTDNEGILARLQQKVAGILAKAQPALATTGESGG